MRRIHLGLCKFGKSWNNFVIPAGYPARVEVLHDAFRVGTIEPSYLSALKRLDQEPYYLNSADYLSFVRRQMIEQKQVVEKLGLKSE